jgi:hypothetical protein
LLLAVTASPGVATATKLAPVDALAGSPRRAAPPLTAEQRRLVQPGKQVRYEERLGVPTFVWVAPSDPGERAQRAARPRDPAAEARRHLGRLASLYGLDQADVAAARVTQVHDTGRGGVIVRLRENVDGVEVFARGRRPDGPRSRADCGRRLPDRAAAAWTRGRVARGCARRTRSPSRWPTAPADRGPPPATSRASAASTPTGSTTMRPDGSRPGTR